MSPESEDKRPDRAATDESLRAEREKTDRALAESKSTVEDDADDIVRKARGKADAVLELARDHADQRAADTGAGARAEARVARERALADEVLREERAAADAGLQREREQQARALALLLPLEREKTDRYLLTERVRSDGALANRDDFLGIVSHDLRNLLYGVLMSAQQLSEPGLGEAGAQEVGERIKRYAARMNRLIGDLLDVDSIDAGRLAVAPVLGDLSAVVREAVDAFHAVAAAKSISLEAEQQEQLPLASFDHDRILQVLANLITNAIKFTPKGGRIRVHCERTGALIRVSVSDSGEGVPAEMLEAIFERFWQVGKDDRRGLGLGLYISRSSSKRTTEPSGRRASPEKEAAFISRCLWPNTEVSKFSSVGHAYAPPVALRHTSAAHGCATSSQGPSRRVAPEVRIYLIDKWAILRLARWRPAIKTLLGR